MSSSKQKWIVGFPHPPADGGPGSFQIRLTKTLQERGHRIVFPEDNQRPDIILVVGGTAKLKWLWDCKKQGTKIIHRLDGINWKHRIKVASIRQFVFSEIRNYLMVWVRRYLADHVIYQSRFVQEWWYQKYGKVSCGESIIYNGVELNQFKPKTTVSLEKPILLCVEGNVQDDPVTLKMLTVISQRLLKSQKIQKVLVCGGIVPHIRNKFQGIAGLEFLGKIPREQIETIFAQDAIFLVLEINPPCPNSVIEAMAAGLPVVGFDTGSLRELVPPEAGKVVPYGNNPWKMDFPDMDALEKAIQEILPHRFQYGMAAQRVAKERFGLEQVATLYLEICGSLLQPDKI